MLSPGGQKLRARILFGDEEILTRNRWIHASTATRLDFERKFVRVRREGQGAENSKSADETLRAAIAGRPHCGLSL
jgi:hypothetical protein